MTRNVPWGQQQLWKTQHLQLIFYDLIPQSAHFKETCSFQSFGLSIVLQLLLSFLYFLPSSSLFLASFSFPSSTCAPSLQLLFLQELVLSVQRLKELSLFSTKSHCQEHNFLQQTFHSSHMFFANLSPHHCPPPFTAYQLLNVTVNLMCQFDTRPQVPDTRPGINLGVSGCVRHWACLRAFPNELTP